MLGISRIEKWRNEIIPAEIGVEDVVEKAKSFKWKWAGHVARMSSGRWSKRVSKWTPVDRKRVRGTPKRRWRDKLEEEAGIGWMRKALDRENWRFLGRQSACSGLNG